MSDIKKQFGNGPAFPSKRDRDNEDTRRLWIVANYIDSLDRRIKKLEKQLEELSNDN